ncbi:MAG: hypothetical protein WC455_20015 [Dehalococcoidia bacterium]
MGNHRGNNKEITTIQLRPSTRELLKKRKRGGETYDDIIRRRFGL